MYMLIMLLELASSRTKYCSGLHNGDAVRWLCKTANKRQDRITIWVLTIRRVVINWFSSVARKRDKNVQGSESPSIFLSIFFIEFEIFESNISCNLMLNQSLNSNL
ncbi:hypothetical protein MtrunA17_Chr7g0276191 [Medicago truncatula]|uniref:Uncharacterized protein n=1 Tax=Medicago truncatula TaxID=3880 RepID=A0A396HE68_MEDTR|nr:hypothetical protein MtrunA17_Chr7g0276191 [Medicago truncatula]